MKSYWTFRKTVAFVVSKGQIFKTTKCPIFPGSGSGERQLYIYKFMKIDKLC